MTRHLLIDPGAAHSAKNATAPGLPNQPGRDSKGRTPMVGIELTRCGACDYPRTDSAASCELCEASADLVIYTPHTLSRLIDAVTERLIRERVNRVVGLFKAELTGHIYRIADYTDADTGEPMQVISADDIPLIVDNVRRRMHAPAFSGSMRGEGR